MIKNEKLKDTIQGCNLNFLIGSGVSRPFLPTLGNIEVLLNELEDRDEIPPESKKLIRVSLYKKYFDSVIKNNRKILTADPSTNEVCENYKTFLKAINFVLLKRKLTLLSKEANLFTTNIDIFLDKTLEDLNLEYNDGFNGRFNPKYSLSNFKKSHFKKSLHYDNTAELPVFNLLKLHGSLSWEIEGKDVVFSRDLAHITEIEDQVIAPNHVIDVPDNATIDSLVAASSGKVADVATQAFMNAYEKLLIVINPTKEKFKHTLMNQTYYELLRLYSNELEKENTVLFVLGFSFADEHICEITLRTANSNPTLVIYVFAYNTEAKAEIEGRFGARNIKNNNIVVIGPEQEAKAAGAEPTDKYQYDFATINKKILGQLIEQIDCVDEEIVSDDKEAGAQEE